MINLEMEKINSDILNVMSSLDLTPFYRQVGKVLLAATANNFKVDGAYFNRGTAWMPLAPSTIRERERAGFTPISILRRRAGDAGLLGSINFTATTEGVEIGTNLEYAKYLHYGTKFMPSRPIFPENELPPEVIEDISDAFIRFFKRLMN